MPASHLSPARFWVCSFHLGVEDIKCALRFAQATVPSVTSTHQGVLTEIKKGEYGGYLRNL